MENRYTTATSTVLRYKNKKTCRENRIGYYIYLIFFRVDFCCCCVWFSIQSIDTRVLVAFYKFMIRCFVYVDKVSVRYACRKSISMANWLYRAEARAKIQIKNNTKTQKQ